jgi:hypothetical protein
MHTAAPAQQPGGAAAASGLSGKHPPQRQLQSLLLPKPLLWTWGCGYCWHALMQKQQQQQQRLLGEMSCYLTWGLQQPG